MKPTVLIRTSLLLAVAGSLLALPAQRASAQTTSDPFGGGEFETLRAELSADREAVIAEAMQFTESESAAFWPLYREYRVAMEKLGDGLVKLVLEYADAYPNVPEDRARQWLQDYLALEKQLPTERASYLKKFGKILPSSKVLRLAQLENRLDLGLRLQLASVIPLAPIEGTLAGSTVLATATAPGVPGGIAVATFKLTATVTAIDPAARKLTLLSPDGIKQTVKVGPDAINFGQINVGDQLVITVAEELVVDVTGAGEAGNDSADQWVALAPEGAKPGGIVATTVQLTATVVAIDAPHRKATLRFEDGTTRTVAVRPDVDLSQRKVGDEVVIRTTEVLAISIQD